MIPEVNVCTAHIAWILVLFIASSCKDEHKVNLTSTYEDEKYNLNIQTIPGDLQCEYYDLGGEGIAFHDTDSINNGSGKLNKGKDYLSSFRKKEAVDISYTKFHDSIDNSKYNLVRPKEGQLYVGWTEPGEWTRYTVAVTTAGTYQIGLMYTANQNGKIAITAPNGADSGPMAIKSTFDPADPINWRQWHHWNYDAHIGEIVLNSGVQFLTLHTLDKGQMNYDYLSFTLKK